MPNTKKDKSTNTMERAVSTADNAMEKKLSYCFHKKTTSSQFCCITGLGLVDHGQTRKSQEGRKIASKGNTNTNTNTDSWKPYVPNRDPRRADKTSGKREQSN